MRMQLISVGTKMPSWVNEGFAEYSKRLKPACDFQLKEIPAGQRHKPGDIARILEHEGELILNAIQSQDYCIVLDVKGHSWSTEQLAEQWQHWQRQGHNLSFVIGGPEGLAPAVYQRSNSRWSLSALTFPHPLARVIVAEQLYRAWSIVQNHPYHRGN